ncbi:MAG: DUF2076 domain-containing protein [Caulobacteraceae bacterium]
MTPDERNILQQFLQDLAQTRGAAKDPDADAMIGQAIRTNPDAAYLLVQHAIIADQALHAAQAQIEQLESQSAPAAPSAPSFLGGSQYYQAQPYAGQQEQAYQGQSQAPAPSSPFAANSGLGGFLRSAGTMAAGVAGGEFLAQGLSNIF